MRTDLHKLDLPFDHDVVAFVEAGDPDIAFVIVKRDQVETLPFVVYQLGAPESFNGRTPCHHGDYYGNYYGALHTLIRRAADKLPGEAA